MTDIDIIEWTCVWAKFTEKDRTRSSQNFGVMSDELIT